MNRQQEGNLHSGGQNSGPIPQQQEMEYLCAGNSNLITLLCSSQELKIAAPKMQSSLANLFGVASVVIALCIRTEQNEVSSSIHPDRDSHSVALTVVQFEAR